MSLADRPRGLRRFAQSGLALFMLAFALRIAFAWLLDSPRAADAHDPWNFGHEAACLARSLVELDFYGDPWNKGTGPSSWLTPPYPFLLSLVLRVGGGVTRESAWILFALQSAASAATCVLLVRLGQRLERPRVGELAGLAFAFYPPAIWNAIDTVWDTTWVAFGVLAFVLVFLRALSARSTAGWLCAGLAFGALLFVNPAPSSFIVAIAAAVWLRLRDLAATARALSIFAAAALAVCLPWMARNANAIHSFSLRPNFGVEMHLGNNDTSTGRPVPFRYHPSHVPEELALYQKLGEKAYADECRDRALTWIGEHPARFAVLTLRRIQFLWLGDWPSLDARSEAGVEARADWKAWIKFAAFGLAGLLALIALVRLDLDPPTRALFTLILLAFGLPYFVTHVSERYRFPIDPLVIWLDAWLVDTWLARKRSAA